MLPQKYQYIVIKLSHIKLHASTEVILEFYERNINSLSKNEKVRKYDVNTSLNQN